MTSDRGDQPMLLTNDGAASGAIISPCCNYRYLLWRRVGMTETACLFIMLNPSTASHIEDDATIRRLKRYAKAWGYGRFFVANLFGLRSTDPEAIRRAADPIGPDNHRFTFQAIAELQAQSAVLPNSAPLVVCAWGRLGAWMGQDARTLAWLRAAGITPQALALTACGRPRHPLYLRADLKPRPLEDLQAEYRSAVPGAPAHQP